MYDPQCDRFFLEDDSVSRQHTALRNQSESLPWNQWIMPPREARARPRASSSTGVKSEASLTLTSVAEEDPEVTNATEANSNNANHTIKNPADPESSVVVSSIAPHSAAIINTGAPPSCGIVELPIVDAQLLAVPIGNVVSTGKATNLSSAAPSSITSPKKTRIGNYLQHFANANSSLAGAKLPSDPSLKAAQAVKWNGEMVNVRVCALAPSNGILSHAMKQHATPYQHNDDTMLKNVIELTQLMRINPQADGFRRAYVNASCTFTALTDSSSSSESEPEEHWLPRPRSPEPAIDRTPVFYRGDRVRFDPASDKQWNRGRILRRLDETHFYDIKATSGEIVRSVGALHIRLLPERAKNPERLRYNFAKGDRVLWNPPKNERRRAQQTYKARITKLRSSDRFDLLLRTGRVIKKVAYEELTPRDL